MSLKKLLRAATALLSTLAVAGAAAQTGVSNTATITPPAGWIDPAGGCSPGCSGNNTSTASVGVWSVSAGKTAQPASGSTVISGQTLTWSLVVVVTGSATTAPVGFDDTLGPACSSARSSPTPAASRWMRAATRCG